VLALRPTDWVPTRLRTVMLIARACRALGDEEARNWNSSRRGSCSQSWAPSPSSVTSSPSWSQLAPPPGALSGREIEVLRLVAADMTNHAIATKLYVSERTVHRPVSNIFAKIGVDSRGSSRVRRSARLAALRCRLPANDRALCHTHVPDSKRTG
jgi:DNA-binding NarL/FixJ family response regulator